MLKRRNKKSGFTLAEVLLATVLLTTGVAGILLPFAGGAAQQVEGINRTTAAILADDMLQIVSMTDYDDIISTYDGYAESQGQIKDATGAVRTDTGYSRFSRTVQCESVYLSQQSLLGSQTFILVTVTVSYNDDAVITLKKLIAKD